MKKPKLSFWQIWNLSFGFLGFQIGYSLQNGNTSRILESLGADVHSIGALQARYSRKYDGFNQQQQ